MKEKLKRFSFHIICVSFYLILIFQSRGGMLMENFWGFVAQYGKLSFLWHLNRKKSTSRRFNKSFYYSKFFLSLFLLHFTPTFLWVSFFSLFHITEILLLKNLRFSSSFFFFWFEMLEVSVNVVIRSVMRIWIWMQRQSGKSPEIYWRILNLEISKFLKVKDWNMKIRSLKNLLANKIFLTVSWEIFRSQLAPS